MASLLVKGTRRLFAGYHFTNFCNDISSFTNCSVMSMFQGMRVLLNDNGVNEGLHYGRKMALCNEWRYLRCFRELKNHCLCSNTVRNKSNEEILGDKSGGINVLLNQLG